ncbi:MAG: presqualene diphosphate synthase HpnD [Chloroflexi bacterium]|nr:presqualene diphosphate synthase HpnD [Chloroflexota bacterium]
MTSTVETSPTRHSERELRDAYEACARMTRDASSNFYYAFLTLPLEKRQAIYATYAFCRLCDDIVDEPDRAGDPAVELANVKVKLAEAYEGGESGVIWTALADSQQRFGIGRSHYAAVIEGCEMDLTRSRYANFDELVEYCKKVASAVGLVCIEVCGYEDEKAVGYAVDLGIAMQLTNVIRDVAEDAANGRIYLPMDDIERFGYSEAELVDGEVNDRFRELIKFQVKRARNYFDRGNRLFPLLDRRSRACPQAMAEVYMAILDKIEDADYDVMSRKVSLSKRAKFTLAARLWLRSRLSFLPY